MKISAVLNILALSFLCEMGFADVKNANEFEERKGNLRKSQVATKIQGENVVIEQGKQRTLEEMYGDLEEESEEYYYSEYYDMMDEELNEEEEFDGEIPLMPAEAVYSGYASMGEFDEEYEDEEMYYEEPYYTDEYVDEDEEEPEW